MAGSAAHPLPEQQRYECDYEIPVGASREPPRLPRDNVLVIDNLAWQMRDGCTISVTWLSIFRDKTFESGLALLISSAVGDIKSFSM